MKKTATSTTAAAAATTSPTRLNNYMGQKGYTLLKKEITEQQCQFIRDELTIRPASQGVKYTADDGTAYPVYRESANKFYLPRYFGQKHFGEVAEFRIPSGEDIDCPFLGDLRDNQKPVVKAYMEFISRDPLRGGGGLLELPCAMGKTVLALHICSLIRKKTLIIVHKEFLLNQWVERIQQFLPTARVGRIQATKIDVEGKDIVIGMLQSLSMKEYPESLFSQFGLTVIDEVHHISSQVFSCALFKIVTKYTLGLSATMNRKDGTTHVFKMFLGEVVYKGARDEQHAVVVRAMPFECDDETFNRIEYDYRGNVLYSTMISKLCAFARRTEFILGILRDMVVDEDPSQQVIVLAHNRSLLTYMHDAVKVRGFATVGYYVGGMKEAALKESEGKQVIMATYSMAAEALDIKTLTTLIMATPKTDIEQAVGRILRQKHGNPLVVDILDSHLPFRNQWAKRKTFYRKQGYSVVYPLNKKTVAGSARKTGAANAMVVDGGSGSDDDEGGGDMKKGKCFIDLGNISFD
jgi:superfamily II DNA or RNA helicase